MTDTHTPTPWRICPETATQIEPDSYGSHDEPVAWTQTEYDARYIVRAVNMHGRLCGMLEHLRQTAAVVNNQQRAGIDIDPWDWAMLHEAIQDASAVLPEARKEVE